MSFDFARRKYRPGYYVNLSSNKAISQYHSKELDKRLASLTPVSPRKQAIGIADNQLPAIINQQSLTSPQRTITAQSTPVYISNENHEIENYSSTEYVKSDTKLKKRYCHENDFWGEVLYLIIILFVLLLLWLIQVMGMFLGILTFVVFMALLVYLIYVLIDNM